MPDDVDQEDDRRAALSAAWDASDSEVAPSVEAPADPPSAEAAPEVEVEPAPVAGDKPRDEKGRFVPGAAPKGTPALAPAPGAQEGVAAPAVPIGRAPATPPAPVFRPPQSWKPEVRELAAKLPAEFAPILEESSRRDREAAIAIQKATETQRQFEPLLRTLQPYAQGLQSRGQDPATVVGNMLRTEQALSHPDERVRAQIIAQALSTYRVGIEALAHAIDGTQAPAQGATTQSIDPQQIIAQAKAEVFKEFQQRQFQSATQAAATEIESFSSTAEFLNEVRDTAAALLETAARGGVALTLQNAYDQACWADPRIRGILQQREASKQAATKVQATQRAHAASSSIKSSPGGSPVKGGPTGDNWREHLEAAWDKAAGN